MSVTVYAQASAGVTGEVNPNYAGPVYTILPIDPADGGQESGSNGSGAPSVPIDTVDSAESVEADVTTAKSDGKLTIEEALELGIELTWLNDSQDFVANDVVAETAIATVDSEEKPTYGLPEEDESAGKVKLAEAESYKPFSADEVAIAAEPEELPVGEDPQEEEGDRLRVLAESFNIYLPPVEEESNAELSRKLENFTKEHEAEFLEKYGKGKLDDKAVEEVLRQFSEEIYPQPEKTTLIQRVFNFFSGIFG